MKRPFLLPCLLLLATGHAGAIEPTDTPTLAVACGPRTSFAAGPSYNALIGPDAVSFRTGPLGSPGPSLKLRVEEVTRDGGVPRPVDPRRATVAVHGSTTTIERVGFDEVYEAVPEGLKQSFHFPMSPPGSGDLVVRLRLETELEPIAVSPFGITLSAAGKGTVHIGSVLGIDAAGRETTGKLRLADDVLELSLPGAFVDAAVYPLVLDPLISGKIQLDEGNANVWLSPADVAWDWSTKRYCVVWSRTYVDEGERSETFAQLFEKDGTPASDPTWISAALDGAWYFSPSVANLGGQSMFVVVSSASQGLHAPTQQLTAFHASSIADRVVEHTHNELLGMDIGGDPHRDEVCLVWDNLLPSRSIRVRRFRVQGLDWIEASAPIYLLGTSEDVTAIAYPRISQANGAAGNWLVVWQRWGADTFAEVRSAAVSTSGAYGPVTVWGPGGLPTCDGNGSQFLIASDADFVSWDNPGRAIEARLVYVDSSLNQILVSSKRVHETIYPEIFRAQVAHTAVQLVLGEKPTHTWSIAWSEEGTGTIRYRSFNQWLKPVSNVEDVLTGNHRAVRIGSLRSAHVPGELAVNRFALGMTLLFDGAYTAVATP